jgi:hypothetical protein
MNRKMPVSSLSLGSTYSVTHTFLTSWIAKLIRREALGGRPSFKWTALSSVEPAENQQFPLLTQAIGINLSPAGLNIW